MPRSSVGGEEVTLITATGSFTVGVHSTTGSGEVTFQGNADTGISVRLLSKESLCFSLADTTVFRCFRCSITAAKSTDVPMIKSRTAMAPPTCLCGKESFNNLGFEFEGVEHWIKICS